MESNPPARYWAPLSALLALGAALSCKNCTTSDLGAFSRSGELTQPRDDRLACPPCFTLSLSLARVGSASNGPWLDPDHPVLDRRAWNRGPTTGLTCTTPCWSGRCFWFLPPHRSHASLPQPGGVSLGPSGWRPGSGWSCPRRGRGPPEPLESNRRGFRDPRSVAAEGRGVDGMYWLIPDRERDRASAPVRERIIRVGRVRDMFVDDGKARFRSRARWAGGFLKDPRSLSCQSRL